MSQAEAVEVLSRMDRTAPAWMALSVVMRLELQEAINNLMGQMASDERHRAAGVLEGVVTCMAAIGMDNGLQPRRDA